MSEVKKTMLPTQTELEEMNHKELQAMTVLFAEQTGIVVSKNKKKADLLAELVSLMPKTPETPTIVETPEVVVTAPKREEKKSVDVEKIRGELANIAPGYFSEVDRAVALVLGMYNLSLDEWNILKRK